MKPNKKKLLAVVVIVGVLAVVALVKPKRDNGKATGVTMDIVPVTVIKATLKELQDSMLLTGTLLANNDIDVIAEMSGTITASNVQVGDHVKAGDVLFKMNDEVAKAAYLSAEVEYFNAKADADRADTFAQHGLISQAQHDAAKLAFQSVEARFIMARKQYNDTKIKTPISGIVATRWADVGRLITAGMKVANVVDIRTLKIAVNLPESDYFKLKVGGKVAVYIDLYPGVSFDGSVATKSVKADEAHTYPVEIKLHNNGKYPLNAGMFCKVQVQSKSPQAVIALPRTSLVGSVHQAHVFVVKNGIALMHPVVTGGEYGNEIEIISGISAGDQVVVSGQSALADSSRVRTIN